MGARLEWILFGKSNLVRSLAAEDFHALGSFGKMFDCCCSTLKCQPWVPLVNLALIFVIQLSEIAGLSQT